MLILYLVVMVAATTKCSVNNLFPPAPDVVFSGSKNRAEFTHGGSPLMDQRPDSMLDF
jgi:hypothetical protein